MKYFEKYPGGPKDIEETFGIFSETMKKFVIPEIPIPELKRIRNLFAVDLSSFVGEVRKALFESENTDEISAVESSLRKIKSDAVELATGKDNDPLECAVLNILHICVEKLAGLLTYKKFQIGLDH